MSEYRSFFSELKRRKVYQTAVAYVVVGGTAWGLLQIASDAFSLGERVLQILIIGSVAAFPVALFAAWVFEVRLEQGTSGEPISGRAISIAGIAVVLAAAGIVVLLPNAFRSPSASLRCDITAWYHPPDGARVLTDTVVSVDDADLPDWYRAQDLAVLLSALSQDSGVELDFSPVAIASGGGAVHVQLSALVVGSGAQGDSRIFLTLTDALEDAPSFSRVLLTRCETPRPR